MDAVDAGHPMTAAAAIVATVRVKNVKHPQRS